MTATLRAFRSTFSQVATRLAATQGPQAALVAGVLAIAMAAPKPAHAQVGAVLTPGQGLEQAGVKVEDSAGGLSKTASVNLGRLIGGIAGFTVGRATDASTAITAVLTGLGVVGGGAAGEALNERAQDRQASEAKPSGGARALPADIDARILALTVDAAAWRRLAQGQLQAANALELQQAASPKDVALKTSWRASEAQLAQVMGHYKAAFNDLRQALNVAERQGFTVDRYAKAAKELAQPVDAQHLVQLDQPQIVERANELSRERVKLGELAEQSGDQQQVAQAGRPALR
jgi:hypothetical protein